MQSLLMDIWHHLCRCLSPDGFNIFYSTRWILNCFPTCSIIFPVHGLLLIDGYDITMSLQWIMNSGVFLFCKNGLSTNQSLFTV